MRAMRGIAPAIVLALAVTGCGRGDDAEAVTVVEDLDLLQAVEDEGSARLSFEMEVSLDGSDLGDVAVPGTGGTTLVRTSVEGLFAYPDGDMELVGTTAFGAAAPEDAIDEPLPPAATAMEVRRVDDRDYVRSGTEGEAIGPWTQTPAMPEEAFLPDPGDLLERLREEAGTLVEVGPEDVRGEATTRYRAEVDRDAIDGGIGLWPAAGAGSVDVWVDAEDRLRRLVAGGLTLELWDFGVPVEVAVPDDVRPVEEVDQDDPGLFAQVTGDWVEQATGTTSGIAWTVFSAPAEIRGVATTCRTLEPDVEGGVSGLGGLIDGVPLPAHFEVLATCGSGGAFGAVMGPYFPDPAVQVLPPVGLSGPALVGFVVAEGHAAGGVRLVRDGADPVELAVDATGVAVWDPTGSPAVEAVELDGGAVTCPLSALATAGGGDPTTAFTLGLDPCVPA